MFPWARSSFRLFPLFLLLLQPAPPAFAELPFTLGGVLLSSDDAVEVRVDLTNAGGARLSSLEVGGELIGGRAQASLGDLEPGQSASAVLTFPYAHEWRPGRHVLPLAIRYRLEGAEDSAPRDARACLVLVLGESPAEPAVRVTAGDVTLDLRAEMPVTLESADGFAHRVRVTAETPRGLLAAAPAAEIDVPPRGPISLVVPLLYGSAPRDSRQGVLVVARTLLGPQERMAFATATVEIAPSAAVLPRIRAPLAVAALVLLVAGLVAERCRRFRS